MTKIYLNGSMLPYEDATLHHDDAGLQHAVGLFETCHAQHGQVFRLAEHLQRLSDSCQQLGLLPTIEPLNLGHAMAQTLAANALSSARIRLTLTPGRVNLLKAANKPKPALPTVLIVATEPTQYDPQYFEDGIAVQIAPPLANPFDPSAGHKTLNYWPRLRTLRQAATVKAGEAIILNITNHLASGCISNVFLVKDDQLLCPIARSEEVADALPAPVLPGITRSAVIALAKQQNIPVITKMLSVDDLLEADEVFLTNSSWQVLPVRQVEQKVIGLGKAGPVTTQLRTLLLAMIESETLDRSSHESV